MLEKSKIRVVPNMLRNSIVLRIFFSEMTNPNSLRLDPRKGSLEQVWFILFLVYKYDVAEEEKKKEKHESDAGSEESEGEIFFWPVSLCS